MRYFTESLNLPERCAQCGTLIGPGRTGRKFCSAACKNRWHNQHRLPDKDREAKRVIRILSNNRTLLLRLLNMGVRNIDRLTLMNLGYNLNYFTSVHKAGNRLVYACLDVKYELSPTRMKKIELLRMGVEVMEEDV